jgi:outer membrane protein assembly factor BamB
MDIRRSLAVTLACVLAGAIAWAQVGRGGAEWLTASGDAQRTSWIRVDGAISVDTLSKPGFELQWKTKVDNQVRQANGLFQGVTANGVTLFVPMSVVAGSSNNIYAFDNDTGYVVWQRHFDVNLPTATAACPGGITAAATRIVTLAPPVFTPRASGPPRGGGYRSLLGEPGEGVPVESRTGGPGRGTAAPGAARNGGTPPAGAPGAARGGQAPAPPPPPARGNQPSVANAGIPGAPDGGGPGSGYGRPSGVVYAVSSDGMLHVLGLPSGKDIQQPARFLPANARWSDAIAVGTMLYTATSGGCGESNASGVWAIDLDSATKPVVSWMTNGGSVVGNVAFTSKGSLIVAVGAGQASAGGYANAIVALDPKTLQVRDWFTQRGTEFVTGPTIFRYKDTEVAAAATKDGRVLLLDTSMLGGGDHTVPLYASRPLLAANARFATEALATWQEGAITAAAPDPSGTRWLLAPIAGRPATDLRAPAANGAITTGGVLALKVDDSTGAIAVEPGWTSTNLTSPATPIIVNGVVFALSTGRAVQTGASAAGRPAMLYAYDGSSGKALWNSQRAMTSPAFERSFWSAMGQVYVGATDGTIYTFGFLDERR